MKNESELNQSAADTTKAEWLEKLLRFPLFNYIPGILGLLGAVALTLVAKIISRKKRKKVTPKEPEPLRQNKTARSTFLAANAPLRVSSAHTVEQNGFFLSLSPQGEGVSIRFRERGGQAKHVLRVPKTIAEEAKLEERNYRQLALWVLAELLRLKKDSKPIYKKLEGTL